MNRYDRNLKILHVINYYHEGFGYQENWLAYHQKKLDNEVMVATSDYYFPFPEYNGTMEKRLGDRHVGTGLYKDNGVNIVRLRSSFDSVGSAGILYFDIKGILADFLPDIVHVHSATNMCIPELIWLKKKYDYQIFIDSHQDYSVARKNGGKIEQSYYYFWRLYYHLFSAKKAIDKFLPITINAQKWLADKFCLPKEYMAISPLGVDMKSMSYTEEQGAIFKKTYGLEDKMIVVNAGKQYREKRIDWIIDVVESSVKRGCNAFLILVGNAGEKYDGFISERLQKIRGAYLRLPFLRRDELRTVYSACDIGIWPGIPSITIQEAMACRIAMILPDDDIVGHLIEGNGLAESKDIDVAAKYICSLDKDKDLLEEHKSMSEQIASRYSWESIAKELLNVYQGKCSQ